MSYVATRLYNTHPSQWGMLKRKRTGYSAGASSLAVLRPYAKPYKRSRKTTVVPGVSRIGGFYGRFSGTRGKGGGELKFHDIEVDDAVVAAGATLVTDSINKIAQGTTESQRIGRKCVIKKIMFRYRVALPFQDAAATAKNGDSVRIIVFLDKQCNGATATTLGILAADDLHSFNNLANSGRFKILLDRVHDLNYQAMGSDNAGVMSQTGVVEEGTWFKDCNYPLEFDSTTGAITEIRSNNIGILLCGAQGEATFNSKIRLRFSDN